MFFNLTGRLTASRPPASNTDRSRSKGGVAHGGDIPYGSRRTYPPPPSQLGLTLCPHYCHKSDHSPEKIAGRLLNSRGGGGAWAQIGADPWVMRSRAVGVQDPLCAVEADHRSFLPQRLRALPEFHFGDASVNPRGPTSGPVVNFHRLERCLLSYRDQPSCHDGTAWQLIYCHSGCQPVWEYLPKYSNKY